MSALITKNLLSRALNIIPPVSVTVFKFLGNTITDFGQAIPSFDAGTVYPKSSAQPLQNAIYTQLGLDFQKEYKAVYVNCQLNGTDKQETPDYVVIDGERWNVFKGNDWTSYDGWSSAIVVKQIGEDDAP